MDNSPVAYSTTSAAKDVEYLIENLNDGEETYVCGGSYASYWTERLMHLAPETVPPAQRFFEYCANSSDCPLAFDDSSEVSPHDQMLAKVMALDDDPNECVKALDSMAQGIASKPSVLIRNAMQTLMSLEMREAIPYFPNLVLTCDEASPQLLAIDMPGLSGSPSSVGDEVPPSEEKSVGDGQDEDAGALAFNLMLHKLIAFSEIWSYPTTSLEVNKKAYDDNLFASNTTNETLTACVFMNEDARPDFCESTGLPMDHSFVHDTDEFFNKTASIPADAGVLFMHGKLDFNTHTP